MRYSFAFSGPEPFEPLTPGGCRRMKDPQLIPGLTHPDSNFGRSARILQLSMHRVRNDHLMKAPVMRVSKPAEHDLAG